MSASPLNGRSGRLSKAEIREGIVLRFPASFIGFRFLFGCAFAGTLGLLPLLLYVNLIEWLDTLWPSAALALINLGEQIRWIIAICGGLLAFLLGGLVGEWITLRRCFPKHAATLRCVACGYDHRGLPSSDGWVDCPECARGSPITWAAVHAAPTPRVPLRKARGAMMASGIVATVGVAVFAIGFTGWGVNLGATGALFFRLDPADRDMASFVGLACIALSLTSLSFVFLTTFFLDRLLAERFAGGRR